MSIIDIKQCKLEIAKWCSNNKAHLDEQWVGGFSQAEFRILCNPEEWDIICEYDECDYHMFNTMLDDTCCCKNPCKKYEEIISSEDIYHTHFGVPVGCILIGFENKNFDGSMRGSVLLDPTRSKFLNIEVHGE